MVEKWQIKAHEKKTIRLRNSVFVVVVLASWIVATRPASNQTKHRISEITFQEESSWVRLMGRYVLRRDHTATLIVPDFKSDTPRLLVFCGVYHDFDRLAGTMEDLGFFKLKSKYESDDYDANTVTVTAVRNGVRKTVVDYGNAGPENLLALKKLMRSEMRKISWKAAEEATTPGFVDPATVEPSPKCRTSPDYSP